MGFLLDILFYVAGAFALVYFIYLQFFSGHEQLRRLNREQKNRPRFERRAGEHGDRRKESKEPIEGEERRGESRRDRDR